MRMPYKESTRDIRSAEESQRKNNATPYRAGWLVGDKQDLILNLNVADTGEWKWQVQTG